MSNSVNLSLELTKTGIQNPLIKVRQGDGGFETLRTTVTANGEPMDLQGWIITFMGTTAGNHKIVDGNVKIVEAPNGIFDYTPSKAWGMDIGEFEIAYFKFVKGDGSASSANFRVNVIEAVDLTQEEAKNYISVVDTTIATINQHLTDSLANVTKSIADANNNANTVASNVTALGNRVDDYNDKLANIKVGGRNLLLNSAFLNGFSSWSNENNSWTIDGSTYQGNPVIKSPTTVGSGSRLIQKFANNPDAGSKITVSFNAKGNDSNGIVSVILYNTNQINVPVSSSFSRYTVSFTIPNNFSVPQIYFWNSVADNNVFINSIKVEFGNVPTDWTPAPEDVTSNDAQLVHKTGNETVAGDKTFTGKLVANNPITGTLSIDNLSKKDLNLATDAGKYKIDTTYSNIPSEMPNGAFIEVLNFDNNLIYQVIVARDISDASHKSTMWVRIRLGVNWGNWQSISKDDNVVHKTENETIAGDKTFTGNINFTGDVAQKTFTATGNGNGITWTAHRTGNFVFLTLQGTTATLTSAGSFMSGFRVNEGMRPVDTATNAIRIGSVSTSTGALRNDGTITFNTDIPASVIIVGSFSYSIS